MAAVLDPRAASPPGARDGLAGAMDVDGMEASLDTASVKQEAGGTGPKELSPLKVTFYELLARQLHDDGFVTEAQSISQQLHIEPNPKADKDALFDIYSKGLRGVFGDDRSGEWTPLVCTPVPPLGATERVLNFDAPPSGAGEEQVGQVAAKKTPEIRLLYTASHKQACRAVAFAADGRTCATGCLDGSIKILDTARMRACAASAEGPIGRMRITEEELSRPVVRTLQDHLLGITCLAFHPTNPTLFSGSTDKAVKIFDLTRPPGHKKAFSVLQDVHPVRCLSIHPCGDFLFVGTSHQAVRLYDLQTLNCFTTFDQAQHHSSGINDLRCTSDGRAFASASADGAVQLWDAVSHRMINRLPKAHGGLSVSSVRWARGLHYLLTSGADGRNRIFDVRMGQEIFSMGFGARSCDYGTAVFAASERYVASANSNSQLSDVGLYDAQTGSPVFMKLGLHQLPVRALEASPVDNTIMTGCDDHNARFLAVEDRAAA